MMERLARAALCLTVATLLSPAPVAAQTAAPATSDSSGSACVVLNGIRIGATWGDSATAGKARTDSTQGGFRLDARRTLDTTFTFDIAERRWTRPSLVAYIAGGVSGRTGAGRTAVAPSGAPGDPRAGWHACVGITLGMEQPTLVLRGVRGQLHFKADLTPLMRIPGATLGDSSRQNQNRR